MVGWDFLNELVLGHGGGVVIDMESQCAESRDSVLRDVFKDEKADAAVLEGMQEARVDVLHGSATEGAVEARGCGGCGDRGAVVDGHDG